jgi:CheY-like chemotaxis protein
MPVAEFMPSVLLAEDEFLIRAVLADSLGSLGISCIEAPTGKEAIEVLASDAPLAAMIVDIGLPDMSGERVIEAALQHRPKLPVIRCSGGAVPAGGPAGVHVFPKPYSVEELSRFVVSLVSAV